MRWMQQLVIPIVAAGIAASCARVPHSPNPDAEVATFRTQYLALHPEGKFNEYILRGELIKGMGALEVLASWGVPDMRRRQNSDESWSYYAVDGNTSDFTVYQIEFEKRVLTRWYIARTTAAAGGLVPFSTSTHATRPEADVSGPFGGDGAVVKKRR